MLTYMSTLRSKPRRFLFSPQKAYFANSPNTNHRLRSASASIRKATPQPASDHGQWEKAIKRKRDRKAEEGLVVDKVRVTQKFLISNADSACWLKRNLIQSENGRWHLRVAEGDERAQREKEAPAAQDACPRNPTVIETPRGVIRGECRGGAAPYGVLA